MRRSEYLTVTEATQRFGVSRSTLHRRIREGALTPVVNGRDRRETLLPLVELRRVFGEYFEMDTKGKGAF